MGGLGETTGASPRLPCSVARMSASSLTSTPPGCYGAGARIHVPCVWGRLVPSWLPCACAAHALGRHRRHRCAHLSMHWHTCVEGARRGCVRSSHVVRVREGIGQYTRREAGCGRRRVGYTESACSYAPNPSVSNRPPSRVDLASSALSRAADGVSHGAPSPISFCSESDYLAISQCNIL